MSSKKLDSSRPAREVVACQDDTVERNRAVFASYSQRRTDFLRAECDRLKGEDPSLEAKEIWKRANGMSAWEERSAELKTRLAPPSPFIDESVEKACREFLQKVWPNMPQKQDIGALLHVVRRKWKRSGDLSSVYVTRGQEWWVDGAVEGARSVRNTSQHEKEQDPNNAGEVCCWPPDIEKDGIAAMQTIVLNTPQPAKTRQLIHLVLPVEIDEGKPLGLAELLTLAAREFRPRFRDAVRRVVVVFRDFVLGDRSLRVELNDRARTRELLGAIINAEEEEYRSRSARNTERCRPPQRGKLPIQCKFSLHGGLLCSQLAWYFRLWYDQCSLWAGNQDTKMNVFEVLGLLMASVELGKSIRIERPILAELYEALDATLHLFLSCVDLYEVPSQLRTQQSAG
ncbi:hypothetical protein HDU86_002394 [Geranomyces michiganensis]|nr:hypothetical protein HDU86_002394 [Geranomyces michiganensis]